MTGTDRHWWGEPELELGQAARWRIGPLSLYAHRLEHEWRVVAERGPDPFTTALEVEHPFPVALIPPAKDALRLAFKAAPARLFLSPAMADRSLVLRPEGAVLIPPNESVQLFVSTPLWLRLRFGAKDGPEHELPIYRPSDTWFGARTTEGELCYASRTHALLVLEDVIRRPHRAITAVTVKNRCEEPLRLDRLKLPVRHLTLFAGHDDSLWTEGVTLDRDSPDEVASMRVEAAPPHAAGAVTKLSEPRERAGGNVVFRAFEALREKGMR
jgi:hypothetical protein